MSSERVTELQTEVQDRVGQAQDTYDVARDAAARRAGEAVRTYDSRVRRLAAEAGAPVDEAVSRYPWASVSAGVLAGVLTGIVLGTGMTLIAMALSTRPRRDD